MFNLWIVGSISNIKFTFRRAPYADFKPISLSLDVACSLSHLSYNQNTFPMTVFYKLACTGSLITHIHLDEIGESLVALKITPPVGWVSDSCVTL